MQDPSQPNQPLGLGPHYSFQPCQEAQHNAVLERSAQQVSRCWVKATRPWEGKEVPRRKTAGLSIVERPKCPEGLKRFHLKTGSFLENQKLHITSSSHIFWHTPNSIKQGAGLHPRAGFQRTFLELSRLPQRWARNVLFCYFLKVS